MAVSSKVAAWVRQPRNWGALHKFGVLVVRRFNADRGLQTASALTYTTLLSLVPLLAVSLAILSGFSAFEGMRESVKSAVLDVLLPTSKGPAAQYIDAFLANAQSLTTPGLAGIAVTALMLLSTIESTFNRIWRVQSPRSLGRRLLRFWSVLTLGPLLLGASLSLTSYFFAVADDGTVQSAIQRIGRLAPLVLQWIAFTLLFVAIPQAQVRFRYAAIGGFVAAALFEVLKLGFAVYLDNTDNYRALYGALAAIPVFLVWLYASWTVILIGAEVTAGLPEWRESLALGDRDTETAAARLSGALALLACLWEAAGTGKQVSADEPEVVEAGWADVLERLTEDGFVVVTGEGWFVAGRDYSRTPTAELWQTLGLGTPELDREMETVTLLRHQENEVLNKPVSVLIAEYASGK